MVAKRDMRLLLRESWRWGYWTEPELASVGEPSGVHGGNHLGSGDARGSGGAGSGASDGGGFAPPVTHASATGSMVVNMGFSSSWT
jgi:hypothetical protein